MKGKLCLIVSLLILSLATSSYVVSTQSYQSKEENIAEMIHIPKIKMIEVFPSRSPPARRWSRWLPLPPQAAGPSAV
ncbi:uncharacterized protein LOC130499891 [Raphanus sativus]|uniref:Uncharacterized protein LOC130499891 n=1 Tax=Raphanus sativus TaxID=3726 RepID=A0A9W3CGB0_RAPSA|nr:uncharacterized protein LOC130499891 [Raphanus sativus]